MTELPESSPNFSNRYPHPVNQVVFETDLYNSLALQYPESAELFRHGIDDVHIGAGINVPRYKAADEDRAATDAEGLNDEAGFFLGSIGLDGFTTVVLTMPVQHTAEEIAQMSEKEKQIASKTHTGRIVIGEIPPETKALLNGMYSLIGAEVVRDDHEAQLQRGTIIRKGDYMGSPVYIEEQYDDASAYYDGKPTMFVQVLGPRHGEEKAAALNAKEKAAFQDLTAGLHVSEQTIHEQGEEEV